jgi:hypothetical protein
MLSADVGVVGRWLQKKPGVLPEPEFINFKWKLNTKILLVSTHPQMGVTNDGRLLVFAIQK